MTPTLTAKEQSLAKIFSDDYVFSIPGYQRPYSWSTEQADELIGDLLAAAAEAPSQLADAPPYFLGSLVKGAEARYRLSPRDRDREFLREHVQHEDGRTLVGGAAN